MKRAHAMQKIDKLEQLALPLKACLSQYDRHAWTDHAGIRLDRAMTEVAKDIRRGQRAAAMIGFSLIMHDPRLPFGKLHQIIAA